MPSCRSVPFRPSNFAASGSSRNETDVDDDDKDDEPFKVWLNRKSNNRKYTDRYFMDLLKFSTNKTIFA